MLAALCRYYAGRHTPHFLWFWFFVLWGPILVAENIGRGALRWWDVKGEGGVQGVQAWDGMLVQQTGERYETC